jgi:hypothetical protein
MKATFIDISDAVVQTLNSASLSKPITAARHYRPEFGLEELAQLHVSVVPVQMQKELAGHSRTSRIVVLDVCVQNAINSQDIGEVDKLMNLLEEIDTFLEFKELTPMPNAQWMKSEMVHGAEAGYAPEHLDTLNCFTGILRLTYKIR